MTVPVIVALIVNGPNWLKDDGWGAHDTVVRLHRAFVVGSIWFQS